MELHFEIGPDFSMTESISRQFGIPLQGNEILIPEMLGQGLIRSIDFPGKLRLHYSQMTLNFPLTISTHNQPDSQLYNIILNPQGNPLSKEIDGQTISMGGERSGGIFYQSPGTPALMKMEAKQPYAFLNLMFTRDALLPYFHDSQADLRQFLEQTQLYLFEDWDIRTEQLVQQILQQNAQGKLETLSLHSRVLEILQFFFKQIQKRQSSGSHQMLSERDIAALMQIRERLQSNLEEKTPSIATLAKEAGFSESKLKRIFSQFFGKTIHQYARYVRMLHAQRLLFTRRYNISEVADAVGYSNLTHFGKAFQDQFGLKPGEYLRHLR